MLPHNAEKQWHFIRTIYVKHSYLALEPLYIWSKFTSGNCIFFIKRPDFTWQANTVCLSKFGKVRLDKEVRKVINIISFLVCVSKVNWTSKMERSFFCLFIMKSRIPLKLVIWKFDGLSYFPSYTYLRYATWFTWKSIFLFIHSFVIPQLT